MLKVLGRVGQFFTRFIQAVLARDFNQSAELIAGFANHQKALIPQAQAAS